MSAIATCMISFGDGSSVLSVAGLFPTFVPTRWALVVAITLTGKNGGEGGDEGEQGGKREHGIEITFHF